MIKRELKNNIQAIRKGIINCHSELVSESFKNQTLKQVQGDKNKKAAFTLAEVLITLGIIGVVAAMTIPTLMANIKGKQYATGFKKELSTLNQMVRMNKAQYDWDFATALGTPVAHGHGSDCNANSNPESDNSICAIFNANLKGITFNPYYWIWPGNKGTKLGIDEDNPVGDIGYYIKVHEADPWSSPLTDLSARYLLSDGSIILLPAFMGEPYCHLTEGKTLRDELLNENNFYYVCTGYIDVNGGDLPNEEVTCSTGTTSYDLNEPCIVKNSHVKDVFPVVFYDSTVAPATNAAQYVLNNTK
ncbi:type II secretion system protein [bacterium]|nr:type II secretion system protein [bacterium]